MCKIGSNTGRTAHFRAVGAQRGALTPDVRSTLHRALRRMAGLVFLLVFWVLAALAKPLIILLHKKLYRSLVATL